MTIKLIVFSLIGLGVAASPHRASVVLQDINVTVSPGGTVQIDYHAFTTVTSPDLPGCVSFLRSAAPVDSTISGPMTTLSCTPDPFFLTINASPCTYESPLGTLTDAEGIHSGNCSLTHSPSERSAKFNMQSSSFSAAPTAPAGTITYQVQAVEQNTEAYSNVATVTITITGAAPITSITPPVLLDGDPRTVTLIVSDIPVDAVVLANGIAAPFEVKRLDQTLVHLELPDSIGPGPVTIEIVSAGGTMQGEMSVGEPTLADALSTIEGMKSIIEVAARNDETMSQLNATLDDVASSIITGNYRLAFNHDITFLHKVAATSHVNFRTSESLMNHALTVKQFVVNQDSDKQEELEDLAKEGILDILGELLAGGVPLGKIFSAFKTVTTVASIENAIKLLRAFRHVLEPPGEGGAVEVRLRVIAFVKLFLDKAGVPGFLHIIMGAIDAKLGPGWEQKIADAANGGKYGKIIEELDKKIEELEKEKKKLEKKKGDC